MPSPATTEPLPELASVYWRPRVDARNLGRRGHLWTLTTAAHVVPFVIAGVVLVVAQPLAFAVSLVAFAHAWLIPELYAARGANVMRHRTGMSSDTVDSRAVGLLGDLVGHEARDLHSRTGVVVERGTLGVWLVGEAGALLVMPGGRRMFCFCVRVPDEDLPSADRIAHLLLALRSDECGFATVANLAFSGAPWRVRRRIARGLRPALDAARAAAPRPAGASRFEHLKRFDD